MIKMAQNLCNIKIRKCHHYKCILDASKVEHILKFCIEKKIGILSAPNKRQLS